MLPLISIIIPIYNSEEYLPVCLESILNQTFDNYEIILIDDCSPGNAKELMGKYNTIYPKIKCLYNKQNLGAGKCRDLAISEATGKYITFVDSDDVIHPQTIEFALRAIEEMDADLVEYKLACVSSFHLIDNKYIYENINKDIFTNKNEIRDNIENFDDVSCNKIFKKDIIVSQKITFTHRIYEDTFFTKSYILSCTKCVKLNAILYLYYIRENSNLHTFSVSKMQALLPRDMEIWELYNKNKIPQHQLTIRKKKTTRSILIFLLRLKLNEWKELSKNLHEHEFPLGTKRVFNSIKNNHYILAKISAYWQLGFKHILKNMLYRK